MAARIAAFKVQGRARVGEKATRTKSGGGAAMFFLTFIGMGWQSQCYVKKELYDLCPEAGTDVVVDGVMVASKAKVQRGKSEMEVDVFEFDLASVSVPNPGK